MMTVRHTHVGYVVSLFPCWSETFILREILALRERGVSVRLFSLKPPSESFVHDAAQPLVDEVVYPPSPWRLPVGFLRSCLEHPVLMFRLLSDAWKAAFPFGMHEVTKALFTVFVASYFARIAKDLGVTHFHAHWATYPALAVRTIRALTGIRYTLTTHAHDIFLPNPYLTKNLSAAHKVVTISDYNRRFLMAAGTPAEKIAVVRCGLDFREFAVNGTRAPQPGTIVSVGRLDPIKGFTYLIEASRILAERGVSFSCDIIGDGPLRAQLERQIRSCGLSAQVHLLGVLSQTQVREVLSRAEVFVLPSVQTEDGNQDGIPVALMEAMALGLPVISTAVSGIPELVRAGESGLLAPPRNAVALADAITQLLTDATLRERLSRAGRACVQARHDVASSAARMQEVFSEVMHAA
ncbi:MAG: glycosyltransferase [Candidatus Binatia bacterium]